MNMGSPWRKIFLFVLVLNVGIGRGFTQSLERVTQSSPAFAPPAAAGGDSWNSSVSPDGRFVLFSSTAGNLTTSLLPFLSPVPARMNVFLRDRTAGTTTLVSANVAGTGGGDGDSFSSAISTNGQFVLFESGADDLVAGDTNKATDIFVRDLVNGTNRLVTVSTNGGFANGDSRDSVMTPDGRYIAFVSAANNLVPGDTNGIEDIFVRDMVSGTIVLASPGAMPAAARGSASEAPEITPDGRYVVFLSTATNLVAGGITNSAQIYLRDLVAGITVQVSSGAVVPGFSAITCGNHVTSDDGSVVAFQAKPLVPGRTTNSPVQAVFRRDLLSGTTDLIYTNTMYKSLQDISGLSMTADGRYLAFVGYFGAVSAPRSSVFVWDAQTATETTVSMDVSNSTITNADCQAPSIDASGRFVSFLCTATNLTTNAVTPGDFHLYVRDLLTGSNQLVDIGTNGIGSSKAILNGPALTPDARFITFDCGDSDLVDGDNNGANDVFLRDLLAGSTELISAHAAVLPNVAPRMAGGPSGFQVSDDGRYIAFCSTARDLAPYDTNNLADIFVRDLLLGTNILVSVATNGYSPAAGGSTAPMISGDGRYVAFISSANNLVSGGYSVPNIFVRDLLAHTTTLATEGSTGSVIVGGEPFGFSADAHYVLFTTYVTNLVPYPYNLYVRDLQQKQTVALATNAPLGFSALMSRNGHVVFAAYWIGPPTIFYLWDTQSKTTILTNVHPFAFSGDGRRLAYLNSNGSEWRVMDLVTKEDFLVSSNLYLSYPFLPTFSYDGQYLAYSTSQAISTGDTNSNTRDVYIYDFETHSNQLISQTYDSGFSADRQSDVPAISYDGRFVAYRSMARNIVPGITNGFKQYYLYDRQTGKTTLIGASAFSAWSPNNRSSVPTFSGDSQTLVFRSFSSDLSFLDYNQNADLFSWKLVSTNPVFSGQILYAANSGQNPVITWPAVPGVNYQVQFKDHLTDFEWQPLDGYLTVAGDRGYAIDLAPSPAQRFYRIRTY